MAEWGWRAGFELEVILGDLGEDRFADYMESMGPMDTASQPFCQTVAKRLSQSTSAKWSAPTRNFPLPGFYVVPEFDLDPLDWPRDRCAGVELITPPLPLAQADLIRREIAEAILDMDEGFDPFPGDLSDQCAWHINIDAGPERLDPSDYILTVDELPILAANGRCFTPYTAIQRHSYGVHLLRHLAVDAGGQLLGHSGLVNHLHKGAGHGKRYAANFAKLDRGYLELRHFAASAFFEDDDLATNLAPITVGLQLTPSRSQPFEDALLATFIALADWLAKRRGSIRWRLQESIAYPVGEVHFDGERVGRIGFNGTAEMVLLNEAEEQVASIRDVGLADIAEALALLALDIVELRRLGLNLRTGSKAFNRAVGALARSLPKPA